MLKNKLTIILAAVLLFGFTGTAKAANFLSIQTLPTYVNTNSFKLSCTTDGATAQFYYSKHGGAFTAFGSAIDLTSSSCLVQVDSSIVNDQTDYTFKVVVDGSSEKTTSTTYDAGGPSSVSGYYKERISDGEYKLHWTNPGDSDFDKVVIYRGDTFDFSADSSHEIARVSGGPNSAMTYDDHFAPDASKTYYYDIRALDHAGNSSGLVGDGGTTTTNTVTQGTPKPTGKVTILPKEAGQGSVLGTESSASPSTESGLSTSPSAAATSFNLFTWIMGHKKISLGIAIILIIIGYYIYKSQK